MSELSTYKPNRVYLTGALASPESERIESIKHWTKQLEEYGYEVINPWDAFKEEKISDQEIMRERIKLMLVCEKIYTLPDWDVCEKTLQEVSIARILKIEINTVLNLITEKT